MQSIDDIRQRTWDFTLTIITVIVLAALGVQSFIGTAYVWWAERAIPAWETSFGYTAYVTVMNRIAAPLILALVVVMGLCVPKRLFARQILLAVSVVMVLVGIVAWLQMHSLSTGLAVYLSLAAVIQVAVVVMTVAGVRGPSYLTEGRLTKTGSGLLHLGFILFAIVVVALQTSSWMLPVFSAAALLSIAGTALSFYANRIAWHRAKPPLPDAPFEWTEPAEEASAAWDGAEEGKDERGKDDTDGET